MGEWGALAATADNFVSRFHQIQLKTQQNLTIRADNFGKRKCQNLINYLTFRVDDFVRCNCQKQLSEVNY